MHVFFLISFWMIFQFVCIGIETNKNYIGISEYEQKYFNTLKFNKQLLEFKDEYAATGSFNEVFNRVNDQGLLAYCDYGKV